MAVYSTAVCVRFGGALTKDQETRLFRAANALRKLVEVFECTHFQSIKNINNLYLLTLYSHIETNSFQYVARGQKMALFQSAYDYVVLERKYAPMAYMTPNALFADNLCQVLNTPFFEREMTKPQTDPAMVFTRRMWKIHTENWESHHKLEPQP